MTPQAALAVPILGELSPERIGEVLTARVFNGRGNAISLTRADLRLLLVGAAKIALDQE